MTAIGSPRAGVRRFVRPLAATLAAFLVFAVAPSLMPVRHVLSADRALEIAIGFVMSFVAALVVVRPFLRFVGRSGFAPFAWYRIAAGTALLTAAGAGWL